MADYGNIGVGLLLYLWNWLCEKPENWIKQIQSPHLFYVKFLTVPKGDEGHKNYFIMLNEIDLKNEIEKQLKNCVFQERSKVLNVTKFKNLNLEIDKFHSTKENIPFYGKISLQLENENGVIEETYDYKGSACVKENIVITIPKYISVSKPSSLG